MAGGRLSSKTSKGTGRANTDASANGSRSTTQNSFSEKPRQKSRGRVAGRVKAHKSKAHAPLVIVPEPVVRAELVDFNTTNTNIIQQLRLITRFPYNLDDDMREKVVAAVKDALQDNVPIDVRLAAASVASRLTAVNLAVVKQLASDQVQRHLSFDRVDTSQSDKQKALESMSDEDLQKLTELADRMGGTIAIAGDS